MAFGGQIPHTKPHRGDLLVEIRTLPYQKVMPTAFNWIFYRYFYQRVMPTAFSINIISEKHCGKCRQNLAVLIINN